MTGGLSLDLARAAMLLSAAYADEERGDESCAQLPPFAGRDRPDDLSEALGLCLDALMRATNGDPDLLAEALWLDGELSADLDTFIGAAGQ